MEPHPAPEPTAHVMLVLGAEGTPEYGRQFQQWAARWEEEAKRGGATVEHLGRPGADDAAEADDRAALRQALAAAAADETRPLWLILIGHGTFDGRTAKFNLRGPDLTPDELAEWLAPLKRPTAVLLCASGSGPFLKTLSAPQRVVVTATDGAGEVNFSRFGEYLSQAIGDAGADLDKDEQVSLLEAFRVASRRTDEFYAETGRIVTEHALLDDNGDGAGTRAPMLQQQPAGAQGVPDGRRAQQWHLVLSPAERSLPPELRLERDRLELAILGLRDRKAEMDEDEYFARLEPLLVQIAELYERAGALPPPE